MKYAWYLALCISGVVGCAGRQTPPAAPMTPPPPIPEIVRAPDPPVWSDPTRQPQVSVMTPAGWTEGAATDLAPGADIVLVHESGAAMISVVLRPTDSRDLDAHAEEFLTAMPEETTSSGIVVAASGDRAWFTWTRHPMPLRPHGAQGKVLYVRFPTVPERMAVVTGIWQQGRAPEFIPSFDRIGDSVALR